MAKRLGITCLGLPCGDRDPSTYPMSLTLGSSEVRLTDMATVASTLATLGIRHTPAPVLKIKDGLGRDVFTYDSKKNEFRAVTPDVAYIVNSIMSDDRNRCLEFGCHGDLTLPGRHVAAKTGTTQAFKDNWTVGFTPSLATAVWVGNPDNTPLNHNSSGIVGAAPIWHKFMMQALARTPDEWYSVPAGVDQVGGNFFLSGTERLQPILAQPWPTCKFGSFNPYNLSYAQTIVDGVPCVLARPKPPAPSRTWMPCWTRSSRISALLFGASKRARPNPTAAPVKSPVTDRSTPESSSWVMRVRRRAATASPSRSLTSKSWAALVARSRSSVNLSIVFSTVCSIVFPPKGALPGPRLTSRPVASGPLPDLRARDRLGR